MSPAVIEAYAAAAVGLIKAGEMVITEIEAGVTAIAGLFGRTLSQSDLDAILVAIQADATLGAQLAALDSGGASS